MNTVGTSTIGTSWRAKYLSSKLQQVLRKALVAEKVCQVDNSDSFYIHNPYRGQPTATVQALTGTYSITAWTITDDSLTVTDEFIYAEHVFDFERVMNRYDLLSVAADEMAYAIATAIDRWVINNLTEDATGAYTTPAGGFTAANTPVILSNLYAKVAGFAEVYKGLYLIIDSTDIPGFLQFQMASGFSFADSALKNGMMTSVMGIDVYVVRSVFADETLGTTTYANAGHRVFGVKGVTTYCSPRGIQHDEKGVSGKTGKETVTWGYCGFRAWIQKRALTVDITLA